MTEAAAATPTPILPYEAAEEMLRRRSARAGLLEFTRYTKPDYQTNWHHDALCRYLDRFVSGEIKRLMVFMPPRHGKSELVSRRLPAYIFGRDPDTSIISCSYGADLASRMNRDVQRIIESPTYRKLFPDTTLFGTNVRTVADGSYLRNSDIFEIVGHTGVYRSAGVGGGITGMGCVYGIIDDPLKNREEASSRTIRETIWEWYTSTFYTRLEKDAQILITMTRWHEGDLAGKVLELAESEGGEKWTIVNFPAVAETPSEDDPRHVGDPLWPEKYDTRRLEAIRTTLGSYQWSALYQQRPTPQEGGMFKRQWFTIIDQAPRDLIKVRRWDLAASLNKGDWTAGLHYGRKDGRFYILDLQHVRESPAGVEALVRQTAQTDGYETMIRMEREPGSSGVNTVDHYARHVLVGYSFLGVPSTGSKEVRAQPVSAAAEAGNVFLVKGPWNLVFLDEVTTFPNGDNDDIVDVLSGAHHDLTQNDGATELTLEHAGGFGPQNKMKIRGGLM
ncbi:TPA_asm: terminase large subunit [Caudoviricetes sp. vir524]|jgi:predicted phage terminase large subunit-like protein|nr:TPA_asm: terminase large subunit [Caudoviricetes sp. vir524]